MGRRPASDFLEMMGTATRADWGGEHAAFIYAVPEIAEDRQALVAEDAEIADVEAAGLLVVR